MMLDILEVFLKHWQHRYIRLDGKTQISERYVSLAKNKRESECAGEGEVTLDPYLSFLMYRVF